MWAVVTPACAPATASAGVDIIECIVQAVVVAAVSRKRHLRGLSRVR